jgi:dTDP-4-dehydrorhamnose reductase
MIWLIGNKGMLGTELSRVLDQRGLAHTGTDREVDITDPVALFRFAEQQAKNTPLTWIINCAAYTAVDKAEDDRDTCRRLNVEGPGNIARAAGKIGARVLHVSTDYVFDGKRTRPYREDDPTDPIGVYGLSKRDGEVAVFANSDAAYIIRSAWMYGQYGNNFVSTMLRLMAGQDTVRVVNDQRGSPTWANDLANTVADLILCSARGDLPYGIYHYTNGGDITWFEFATEIYAQGRALGLLTQDCAVIPCTSTEYPAKVTRPAYSVLDKSKIQQALGIPLSPWDTSLRKYLELCVH